VKTLSQQKNIDERFYGMTGFKRSDNLEFLAKFQDVFVSKGAWIFPDEYYTRYVYVVKWDKALTIVAFSPTKFYSVEGINDKISTEFKEMIANKAIQIVRRPYVFLN
jgi:hypothetical protein